MKVSQDSTILLSAESANICSFIVSLILISVTIFLIRRTSFVSRPIYSVTCATLSFTVLLEYTFDVLDAIISDISSIFVRRISVGTSEKRERKLYI